MPHELRKGERCNSENTASNRKEAISTTIHKLTFELTWSKFKRSSIHRLSSTCKVLPTFIVVKLCQLRKIKQFTRRVAKENNCMLITVSSLNFISRCKRQWSSILRRVVQSSKVDRWRGPSRESRRGMSGRRLRFGTSPPYHIRLLFVCMYIVFTNTVMFIFQNEYKSLNLFYGRINYSYKHILSQKLYHNM